MKKRQELIMNIGKIIGSYVSGCVICKDSVNNELKLGDMFEVHYRCFQLVHFLVELNNIGND